MKYVELSSIMRSHAIIERLRECESDYGYIQYPCDKWIFDISHIHLGYFILHKYDEDTCANIDPVHMPYGYQDTGGTLIERYPDYNYKYE